MNNKITISLLIYNGARYLPFCLASLFNQSGQDWELIILDNGSDDNSGVVAAEICAGRERVKTLPPEPKNIGFAAGHNKIIKTCQSEFILLLNQDIIMEPDYIDKLKEFMENNPRAGAVSGKILRWNFKYAHKLTNAGKTDIIDTAGLRVSREFRITDIGSGSKDSGQYDNTEEVFGVSGCLPLYRTEALAKTGYFDERFFSYKEDIDLAFRLYYEEWQTFRVGGAVAYHDRSVLGDEKAGELGIINRHRNRSGLANYLSYRNHLFLLIKNLAAADFARYGIFIFWYELKKFLYILLFERRSFYAFLEIFKQWPRLLKEHKKFKLKSVKMWIK
ncbi:MAG: glycosyltransferase family 2 protein [Methanoregula sp.]|jgi:GT2 family glycosyltransferase|nr:glycosyltransferase family 2 protein [Methanoregula sp.]